MLKNVDSNSPRFNTHWAPMLIVVAFIATRLPSLLLAPGGQDEEWYAIPGLTIAQEGIPRVPYSRATAADSVFRGADEMLFGQPPLSFYVQAIFFRCLPGTYGTARLASMVAACVAIVLTYHIGLLLFQSSRIAFLGSLFYSLSRLFFFPAIVARPDMLCGTLGLLSFLCMIYWQQSNKARWLVGAGLSVGLAGLTHPFAIVFAVQMMVWTLLVKGSWIQRFRRGVLFSICVAATFSLWLPMIVQRPDLFRAQFFGNIIRPSSSGLLSRFVIPFESFSNQIPQLVDRAHPIQFGMLAFALIASGILAFRMRQSGAILGWSMAISSIYLLIVFLGVHPIQGFWCYSAALSWLCFAYVLVNLTDIATTKTGLRRAAYAIPVGLCLAAMLPGSGIRTIVAYASHWNETLYSSPTFIRAILEDLPANAQITVGPEFALDAYACGREVILACRNPMYYDSADYPTEYYIFGRRDFAENMVQAYRCEFVKSYGSRDNEFQNYAEVYRRIE